MKTSLFLAFVFCTIKLSLNFPITESQKFEAEVFKPYEESHEVENLLRAFELMRKHRFHDIPKVT